MTETIDSIILWHSQTFPDATIESQKAKWNEEYDEFCRATPGSEEELHEVADMIIVACGIMRFNYALGIDYLLDAFDKGNFEPEEKWKAVEEKQAKNRRRMWHKTPNGAYHHENGIED